MDNRLISVIVPVFNKEAYLDRCLNSLLYQTYKNLEIILVNDGSTDRSGTLCDGYAKIDERCKVFHKQNSGVADARNVGLEVATGDLIAFMDPDDACSIYLYQTLLELLDAYDADVSMCSYIRFSGERIACIPDEEKKIRVMNPAEAVDGCFGYDGEKYVVPWNKLIKRTLVHGIRFPSGRTSEDEFTVYKFLANANRVVLTNEILYYYCYHQNSETTQQNYCLNLDIYDAYDERLRYLNAKGFLHFEAKTHKQYLDRLIQRNRALVQTRNPGAADLLRLYRKRFREKHGLVPGIGYRIYYVSPRFYDFLLTVKKNLFRERDH